MKNVTIFFFIFFTAVLPGLQRLFAESSDLTETSAAQAGRFIVTIGGVVDAFYLRSYSGDYSARNGASSSSESPYKYQGDGIINAFQSSAFDYGVKGRAGLSYSGKNLGGSMELRMTTDSEYSAVADWDAWFKLGPWADFIGLRILGGNTVQNGCIPTYDNFDVLLKSYIKNLGIIIPVWRINTNSVKDIETISNFPYGYEKSNTGSDLCYAQFYGTETYDLFMPAGAVLRKNFNLLTDIQLTPLTLSFALGGVFENETVPTKNIFEIETEGGARSVLWDGKYDPAVMGGINFGFRAESTSIADLVTIAAVYKLNSSFKQKVFDTADITMNTYALADIRKANHNYGLYAALFPLDVLGISLGYSGQYQTWKNPHYQSVVAKDKITDPSDSENWYSRFNETIYPLYHGIDLRLLYSGIKKITFTLNNNISFARACGIDGDEADKGIYTLGWAYSDFLGNKADRYYSGIIANDPDNGSGLDRRENYFGLFNALNVRYAITNQLAADGSVSSQFGRFSLNWNGNKTASTTSYLGIYIGVLYTIFDIAGISGVIRGGLDMRLSSFTYQAASITDVMPKYPAGVFEFGIPVSLMLQY